MTEPLFLKPVFHEKIWGGRRLAEDFNYDIPDGTIGECWAISGHPHGPNVIENGEFKGQLLPDVYAQHPEVFGNPKSKVFPLLTKILDAEASLSVQVHPDNAYAEEHEHELGKTECWYVIHADEGAYLTYGHTTYGRPWPTAHRSCIPLSSTKPWTSATRPTSTSEPQATNSF